MIQAVIARMAGNSFLLKGWSVTLVAALFALAAKDANKNYVNVAFIPVVIFWILDAYYLYEERLFRGVYDRVRRLDESQIDFSMTPTREGPLWTRMVPFYDPLLLVFYGALIAAILSAKFLGV